MGNLNIFIAGVAMGTALLIPGVSGSTLVLLLGVYERFLAALGNISWSTLLAVLGLVKFNRQSWQVFSQTMRKIDALGLLLFVLGALLAIAALVYSVTFLLKHFYAPIYGLFFGLAAAALWIPLRQIKKPTWITLLVAVIALGGMLALVSGFNTQAKVEQAHAQYSLQMQKEQLSLDKTAYPSEHRLGTLLYFTLMGALFMSLLLLPGVSSYLLLWLLGIYFNLKQAMIFFDPIPLGAFVFGNVVGLLAMSRGIKYVLAQWRDLCLSVIAGLMLGSLWMLWPFKVIISTAESMVYTSNYWPDTFGIQEGLTLLTMLLGLGLVFLGEWSKSFRNSSV